MRHSCCSDGLDDSETVPATLLAHHGPALCHARSKQTHTRIDCTEAMSRELEAGAGVDSVEELVLEVLGGQVGGQLEQVHARARGREAVLVLACYGLEKGAVRAHAMDGERRLQRLEAQQGRARAARHELEQRALLLGRQGTHHLPELAHGAVKRVKPTRVHRVRSEVGHVEVALALAADEDLELNRVEEADPVDSDDILEASEEGLALSLDLLVEAVVGDKVEVLNPVAVVDLELRATRHELVHAAAADVVVGDCEVEAEVGDVPLVILEDQEVLVQGRVERWQLVEVVVLAEQLGQEEAAKGQVHLDAVKHGFTQHPAEEGHVLEVVVHYMREWVRIELTLGGKPEKPTVWALEKLPMTNSASERERGPQMCTYVHEMP